MRDAYGFPLLIRACGKLADSGFKPSVLLVISGDEDPITYERVHAAIAETRGTVSVKIHHELPRDEVLGAVRAADLLVRPTRFDGDSLTIHEAIQLGTPVVASDAAPRPPGVHIHITDDSDSLRDIMIQAIRSPAPEPSTLRDIDPVDRLERALQENAVNWSV